MTEKFSSSLSALKRIKLSDPDFVATCQASKLGYAIDSHTGKMLVHYPTLDFRMEVPRLWYIDYQGKPIPPWQIVLEPHYDWSNCSNLLKKNLSFIRARDERIFFGLWHEAGRVFELTNPPDASHLLLIAHQYHGGSKDFWNIKPLEAGVYQNSLANWQITCLTGPVARPIRHRYDILLCELAPCAYPRLLRYNDQLYRILGEQAGLLDSANSLNSNHKIMDSLTK